jgi:glyoxalase/bleomycin resistance protein/dioxygenase superfamily protein
MRILACVAIALALTGTCAAQLPDIYKTVNRVTWVVANVDHAKQGWIGLGMSGIQDLPDTQFTGQYRGKTVTIKAHQITAHLGNLTVDMIQPAAGQRNAFTEFLTQHGDGIFSIVHEVSNEEEMTKEVQRMSSLGVGVLQQISVKKQDTPVTYTYFDTAPQGKFVLGLVYWSGGAPAADKKDMVSHLAPVIRESDSVSAFWQKIGLPSLRMEHATPREDSRYHGKPLWFAFEVGYQHYDQFSYEWIIPPTTPANVYVDYLKAHGEGIQHIGIPVEDLEKSVAAYEKLGYHVLQSGAWGDVGKKDSGQYDYMDTDSIGGVSVELIHAYH